MRLSDLFQFAKIPARIQDDMEITGLARDSRDVQPGFLFAAMDGFQGNARDYIDEAVQNGAVAVLTNHPGLETTVPVYYVDRIREALALMSVGFYQPHPHHLAAVTGTNGKTSTVFFLRQIWEYAGHKSASLGTLGVQSPDYTHYSGMTTSASVTLNQELQALARTGVTHAALEASSHGLDQHRLDGLTFEATAFTNLTRDHLDYHKTMENYLKAKMRLFTELTAKGGTVVLNADIPEFDLLDKTCRLHGLKVLSYGHNGRELKLIRQTLHEAGQDLSVQIMGQPHDIKLPVAGAFQGMNILCALGLAIGTGIDVETALQALQNIKAPDGRMELIGRTPTGASIFVDYAHTPDGLETALKSLRHHTQNKLHVLFGCGGNRDMGKRPMMGKIAGDLADEVIVTDDNPRFEDAAEIRRQILSAVPTATEIDDRAVAIFTAVSRLKAGDVLLLAGKGHEEGQLINGMMYTFNDRIQALLAIKALTGKPLWTKQELQEATGGLLPENIRAYGVSIDTRTLQPGDLFIALKGDRLDGHDYVEQALKKGAVAALVDHPMVIPDSDKLLVVPDTGKALHRLAQYAKNRSSAVRIGITGSSGKTTSKEMLMKALSTQGTVHATQGNLNNEWGVPLTLARLPKDADFAVIEMGMSHSGELTELSKWVTPQVVMVTMIGSAHREFFASEEAIAEAKSEIFSHLQPGGTAVLNADSPFFDFLKQKAASYGVSHILSFGQNQTADSRLIHMQPDAGRTTVRARVAGKDITFAMNLTGLHFVQNALGVLAVVAAINGDLIKAADGLSGMTAVKGRGAFVSCTHNGKTFTVIDDAYNANPSSMAASIRVLGMQPGRKIAVLGDMLELGDFAESLHTGLIDNLLEIQVDKVYAVGVMMKKLYDLLPPDKKGAWAEKASDVVPTLESGLESGDFVLVKGSNSMKLYDIVKILIK